MLVQLLTELRSFDWVKDILQKGELYIVGGCVRDALMQRAPKDIDLVVEGLSLNDVNEMLKMYGKTGIFGQSFSVIKFRPKYHTGEDFDIAVPRTDRKIGVGHTGFEIITEGVTIVDDLKRRDFTINSIAVNIRNGKVIDPFGGVKDISRNVLKATDSFAFLEDPLRILRAIQFSSRFNSSIDPDTLRMMKSNAHLINEISGERILDEFNKIVYKQGSSDIAFDLIERTDIDKALFGKKIDRNDLNDIKNINLDVVSFYYTLAELCEVSPWKFYKERLKGEAVITKALMTLESFFDKIDKSSSEANNRWQVFQLLKTSPMLMNNRILPKSVSIIIDKMKAGEIPMKFGDIHVNGNDITDELGLTDKELGIMIVRIYQDALMNIYNWKDRNETLKYLKTL